MPPELAAALLGEMRALRDHVTELHEDVGEVKELAKATNGRVRKLELWQARVEGAKAAVGWMPPLATGVACAIAGALAGHFLGG